MHTSHVVHLQCRPVMTNELWAVLTLASLQLPPFQLLQWVCSGQAWWTSRLVR